MAIYFYKPDLHVQLAMGNWVYMYVNNSSSSRAFLRRSMIMEGRQYGIAWNSLSSIVVKTIYAV